MYLRITLVKPMPTATTAGMAGAGAHTASVASTTGKICEKVLKKGVQDELECIVARDDLSEASIATNREDAAANVIDKCPALKQLDDPVILGHLCDSGWTSFAGKIGEEVLAWQALQGCQRIPNRRSHDVHEKTLAKRFEDVLRRRYCAIGQWQCQQQLSADEIDFINGIPRVSPVNPWLPSAKQKQQEPVQVFVKRRRLGADMQDDASPAADPQR